MERRVHLFILIQYYIDRLLLPYATEVTIDSCVCVCVCVCVE